MARKRPEPPADFEGIDPRTFEEIALAEYRRNATATFWASRAEAAAVVVGAWLLIATAVRWGVRRG